MSVFDDIVKVADGLAFGVPGGGASLELIDAIERANGRFHTTRFEGAAALMAGAVGRLRGRPGVVISIKGPGLANMAGGLATAMLEDLPILAVAEAYGRADGTQKAHKRLDHDRLVSAVTKARCGIVEKDAVTNLASLALAERPGPVLLELADTDPRFPKGEESQRRDTEAVIKAVELAKHPVVIAGSLALRQGLSDILNRLSVPIFSTAAAKGVVDEHRTHAAGVYTGAGLELAPEQSILAAADLVVGIGLRTHEVLVAGLRVAAVNIDDLDAAPGFEFSAIASVRDARQILETLAAQSSWDADIISAAHKKLRTTLLSGPFLPAHVFTLIAERLPRARVVLDTGFFCTIGEHMWEVRAPDLYLSSGQGRSMGAALPMAVAAAVHRAADPTVLVIGDGGLGMFVAELGLAATEKAPLLVAFMCDGTYASIRDRAVTKGLTERPLIAGGIDWMAVAAAMGFASGRADTEADVADFFDAWGGKGPAFLEIRFDPEPYRIMCARLRG